MGRYYLFGGGWHFDCKILSYDGLTWTYYDDHNTGLPSNRIKCLASQNENVVIGSDAQGDPVGGVGGGLTFFNGSGWATSNWSNSGRITEILCMATENDGTTWMGALQQLPFWSGLIKFNGDTAIYYDPTNSGLPSGYIFDIEIDTAGRKWIATGDKVALFDDTSWQIMEFDHYYVFAIERSPEGEMWFAGDGIITFDGVNWLTFDHTITGTDMNITSIAFAPDGAVLFGNNLYSNPSNIIRFDGNTWQIYTPDNSGLPTTNITGLASESSGVLWIATGDKGAVRFDGTSWTAYNTANSYLPSDAISCLLIDAYDNKWFGFLGWESYNSPAIAIFNENGVFTQKPVTEPTPSPSLLLYPNPFTSQVTLEMELRESPEASIQILSADGRVVKMITGEAEFGGHMHKVIDGAELPPGLYFVIVQTSNQISRGKVLKI